MPGKYSHSVVLADYSSRGIINLPNDQHVAYLKTIPYSSASQFSRKSSTVWSEPSSAPQHRSQSAMAYSSYHLSPAGRDSATQRHVIIDTGAESGSRHPKGPPQQRPSTSDNANPTVSRRNLSVPRQANAPTHVRTMPAPVSTHPVTNKPLSNTQQVTRNYTSIPSLDTSSRKPTSIANFEKRQPSATARVVRTVESDVTPAKLEAAVDIRSKAITPSSRITNASVPQSQGAQNLQKPQVIQAQQDRRPPRSPERQRQAPGKTADELNFEGFSDSEDQSQSYLAKSTYSPAVNERTTTSVTHPTNRFQTPSPRRAPSRSSDIKSKQFRPVSTEPADSEPMTHAGASPLRSVGKLNSITSLSTVGSKEAPPVVRTNRHGDPKKPTAQPLLQDWRLPEISENGAFGPDFFSQGPEDVTRPRSDSDSVDSFLNRPLGTISAGRDVDFTQDDDDDSEADAACPPDIGRFRQDDDPETSVFFQTLKGDGMVSKSPGSTTQPSRARKIGFFARMRSKSRSG